MFKFLKKLMLVGVVAGATVYAVKNTKVGGHVRHEAASLSDWAESQVPVDKKIAKLRKDVGFLSRDIEKTAGLLAKEIVETRMLGDEVAVQRAGLERQRTTVLAHGKAIEESLKVGLTDKPVRPAVSKDQLRAEVAAVKDQERQVATKDKMLELKERNKATLEAQLGTLKTKKLELETAISQCETKFKELQLVQMESKFQSDDTRLSRIKADLRELNKVLDIEAEKLKLAPTVHEEAKPADGQSVQDILSGLGDK